ncbi:MAG: apolipoprotein N-acyltransferase [Spirochaetota bacterium]|nr:MAG: apolipoprotein N-acyltransferase [Spirochaetota bacterium]
MQEPKWYIAVALSFASAFMLLLSYPTYNINILGFFALAPIFFLVYTTNTTRTIGYGILAAFPFYCLYLFWMNAYLPVIGVAFVTVVFGGYFVIALIFINILARALPKYRAAITPFIWISIEYIRSFGFLSFTFGSIGYTQHNFLRFIQIADIGGEPLVSFVLVLFNACLADFLLHLGSKRHEPGLSLRRAIPIIVSAGLIVASLVYGTVRLNEPISNEKKMKLVLVQALSSPRTEWKREKWGALKRLIDTSRQSFEENKGIDLIVWTETAIRTSLRPNLIHGTSYHTKIQKFVQDLNTSFIIGSPDNFHRGKDTATNVENLTKIYPTKGDEEVWTNSAYFLDANGEIISKYDKIMLTPFGEHFPIGKRLRFLQRILDKFTDSAGFTPGTEYTVFEHEKMKFSVVICWEGTYGYFIRKFVLNGADFIVNISNDMWTKTRAGHFQHFSMTKFRAVENRIWYARAANDGVTAFINPHGKVVNILPIKEVGYITGEVGNRIRPTFYTKNGDVLPKTSLFIFGLSFIFSVTVLARKPLGKEKGRPEKKRR